MSTVPIYYHAGPAGASSQIANLSGVCYFLPDCHSRSAFRGFLPGTQIQPYLKKMTSQPASQPFLTRVLRSFAALRRSIQRYCISLAVLTLLIFFCSPRLLQAVQEHLGSTLYFFSVAGPFLAHVKLSLFGAFFLLCPWFALLFWRVLGRIFRMERRQLLFFTLFSCLLFYLGTVFCYVVTLPFGIEFLLGFGSAELKPVISVGRCIHFVTVFILVFGLVFELPVLMAFFFRAGVFTLDTYRKNRRYAVLVIAILAAILTPTPDVVNMALMGVPLYLLYEAGICIVQLMKKKEE